MGLHRPALGDPAASVARAMSVLFLQPSSALLWNTYGGGKPWSNYTMGTAVDRLRQIFPGSGSIVHRAGKQADLMSWHRAIDPLNRFGLILMNSTGGPRHFTITGGPGRASDLPSGIPAAVSTIHSFSAADPTDPQTIAGRWLDQGAFVYYGSMNEPYVDAFRCPRLIAELITAEVPLAAALRQGEFEAFGPPVAASLPGRPALSDRGRSDQGRRNPPPRFARLTTSDWQQVAPAYAAWQVVEITAIPAAKLRLPESHSDESENVRLGWCLDAAIEQLTAKPLNDNTLLGDGAPDAGEPVDWRSLLRQVRRDRLDPKLRPVFDDLLIDTLMATGELLELNARLGRIPTAERGTRVLAGTRELCDRPTVAAGAGSRTGPNLRLGPRPLGRGDAPAVARGFRVPGAVYRASRHDGRRRRSPTAQALARPVTSDRRRTRRPAQPVSTRESHHGGTGTRRGQAGWTGVGQLNLRPPPNRVGTFLP